MLIRPAVMTQCNHGQLLPGLLHWFSGLAPLDCSLPEGFGIYLRLRARSHSRPNIRSDTSGLKECIIWVRKRDGQTGNPGETCSVKGWNRRAGAEPASAYWVLGRTGLGREGPGRSGPGASVLVGCSRARHWAVCPSSPSSHPSPSPRPTVPGHQVWAEQEGGFSAGRVVKAHCVLKLGAEVRRGGSLGSRSDPGVIVVSVSSQLRRRRSMSLSTMTLRAGPQHPSGTGPLSFSTPSPAAPRLRERVQDPARDETH